MFETFFVVFSINKTKKALTNIARALLFTQQQWLFRQVIKPHVIQRKSKDIGILFNGF